MKIKNDDFDFSGKRVRKNGKPLTKYDLSWEIAEYNPWSAYAIYPDFYPYEEYKKCLMKYVNGRK